MEWTRSRDDGTVTEWDRADGHATVRLRERPDGSYAVRLDVLEQATEGRRYDHEIVESRAAAADRLADWTDGGVRADDGDGGVQADDGDGDVQADDGDGGS